MQRPRLLSRDIVRRPAPLARHQSASIASAAPVVLRLAVPAFITLLWFALAAGTARSAPATTGGIEVVDKLPRGVHREEIYAPSPVGNPSPLLSARRARQIPPPLEEVYVFQDSLDGYPLDDEGGWTHYDASEGVTAWHRDTFLACAGTAWWCGKIDSTWTGDPNRAGYMNSWDQFLENSVNLTGVPLGTPVTITVKHRMDVEPNYDFGLFQINDLHDFYLDFAQFTGKVPASGPGCDSFTVAIPESIWTKWNANPTGPRPTPFRFVFKSDISHSSADGLYPGDGWIIDEVRVNAGSEIRFYDNMENSNGAWTRTTLPGVGDFFDIESDVITEDLCYQNRTNLWVDWDPVILTVVPRQDNRLITPAVDTDRGSQVLTAFDIYRNMPLDGCFYYSVNYRHKMVGGSWSNWFDPTGLLYYGSNKDWIRQKINLPLAGGKDSVQVMFIVKDYGPIYCGGSTGYTNIYPLFDNVAIGVRAVTPPIFTARDIDLFQDTFKTTAFFNGGDNFNTPVGDSTVIQVSTPRGYKSGFMYYRLNSGSWFSIPLQVADNDFPTIRHADVPLGNYPANTTLWYYFAVTDSTDSTSYLPTNAPSAQVFYSASILPLKTATNPALGCADSLATILFVNNSRGYETEATIAKALTAYGFKFDTWDVNAPTTGAGNTPGGIPPGDPTYIWPGSTTGNLTQYSSIIWHSGSLAQFTMRSTDQALIQSWIQQAGKSRNIMIAGDDIASDLIVSQNEINSFLSFTMGSRFLRDLWENFPQDSLHPVVTGLSGSPSAGRSFHVNMDCPTMEDSDLIAVATGAPARGKTGLWLRYPNTFAAATRFATKYTPTGTDSARSIHMAFNYNNIEETGERYRLIKDIVNGYFKINACYYATAVETEPTPSPVLADVLHQNAPNPFNPVTTIRFSVAQAGQATIHIYSVGGTLVRTLVKGHHAPGSYSVRWDGRDDNGRRLASGVYFYKLETPSGVTGSKKLIMLK
jgi:FlgD Ig-like domain